MYYTDDPVRDFDAMDREQARRLERLPKCKICGEPIQQEGAVCILGDYYCDHCLDDNRVDLNDFD